MKKLLLAILLIGSLSQAKTGKEIADYVTRQVVMILNIEETAGGTGFYLRDKDKVFIITNDHICQLSKNGELHIFTELKEVITATVIRTDPFPDLCLINASNKEGLELAEHSYPYQKYLAVGHADLQPLSFIVGPVVDHVFLGKVRPGNSGSPVTDRAGNVIGVLHSMSTELPIGFMATLEEIQKFLGAR